MLCEYGCNKEAKFKLKNGKWCCSENWNSCPGSIIKFKNRPRKIKLIRENPGLCEYGCGQEAKYYFKISDVWCCSKHHNICPINRSKSSIAHKGIPSKNKGKRYKPIKENPGLCEYGCGQEAKHQLKNEKWCCSEKINSCPAFIEKIKREPEKIRDNSGLCENGCGQEAKYYFKSSKKWYCSKHISKCPVIGKKITDGQLGKRHNTSINIKNEEKILCECCKTELANFILKNKKLCCSETAEICFENKKLKNKLKKEEEKLVKKENKKAPKKPRAKAKIIIKENNNIEIKCKYGCGKIAKFLIGFNETPCCSDDRMRCDEERRKNTERQLGNIPWNKGLTIDDPRVQAYSESSNKTRNEKIKNGEIIVWNKGLTIDDPRVKSYTEKSSKNKKGKPNYKLRKPITNEFKKSFGYFIAQFKKIIYTSWVFPILKRDNFKCTICNTTSKLEVHHLKKYQNIYMESINELNLDFLNWRNWSKDDIIKLEQKILEKHKIENGTTVCILCHAAMDKHRKAFLPKNKKELLIEHEKKYFGRK